MDRFHIYEEIGSGLSSQVYKGRERSKISFCAIKRVDKSCMPSISTQVALMHRLSSPHILKFHDWYETRNNLWLILEYAPGGDLKALLNADQRMPEEAVKMFGVDLMAGLQYLHAKGILYGDMKPSNVLVDEFGVLKLSDFGQARKVPSSHTSVSATDSQPSLSAISTTGSPHYMAPELFTSHPIPSYSSELWSLGCVLYEMFYGKPPFTEPQLPDLMHQIINDDPAFVSSSLLDVGPNDDDPNADSLNQTATTTPATPAFHHLLTRLLQKNPLHRPTWAELLSHPFFAAGTTPAQLPLPPQPLFTATQLAALTAKGLTQDAANQAVVDADAANIRPSSTYPRFFYNAHSYADYSESERGRSSHVYKSSPRRGRRSDLDANPNILRMSRNVTANFKETMVKAKREQEENDENRPMGTGPHVKLGKDDQLTLTDTDAVCDFRERAQDHNISSHLEDAVDVSADNIPEHIEPSRIADSSSHLNSTLDSTLNSSSSPSSSPSSSHSSSHSSSPAPSNLPPSLRKNPQPRKQPFPVSTASSSSSMAHDLSQLNITNLSSHNRNMSSSCDQPPPPLTELDTLSNCSLLENATSALTETHAHDDSHGHPPPTVDTSHSHLVPPPSPFLPPSSRSASLSLLLHPSDATVKPIVGNKTIEPSTKYPTFRVSAITSLTPRTRAEVKSYRDGDKLETYFGTIYKTLASSSITQNEKAHLFGYLYSIADLPAVANLIANSSFLTLLIRLFRKKTGLETGRVALIFVLGIVIRHASYIAPDASEKEDGLLHVLTSVVKNKDEPGLLRRHATAALGELIFYVATGAEGVDTWVLPADAINTLTKCLVSDADPIISLYATKTIENVLAQSPPKDTVAMRLCTKDILQNLVQTISTAPDDSSGGGGGGGGGGNSASSNNSSIACVALSHLLSHLILGYGPGSTLDDAAAASASAINLPNPSYSEWYKNIRVIARALPNPAALQQLVVRAIGESAPLKTQQSFLNIINLLLYDGPLPSTSATSSSSTSSLQPPSPGATATSLKSLRAALTTTDKDSVVYALLRLAERGQSLVIRAKALLCIRNLVSVSPAALSAACERRLLPFLERVAARKVEDEYFWTAASSTVHFLKELPKQTLHTLRQAHAKLPTNNIQQHKKELRQMSEVAAACLPSVVQCISCSLLRDEGCVDGQLIRDLGWALYTFGKDEELCRLLLNVLEMLVEFSDCCVFAHCEEFIDSIVPVLCRFLNKDCKDSKTLSLSLLRLVLPGIFVHLTATGAETQLGLLVRLCEQQLIPALGTLLDEEESISQYAMLLVGELSGATGNVYGKGVKSVWHDFSSAIARSDAGFVEKLMEKMGGGVEGRVLANCLRMLVENGFKEEIEQNNGPGLTRLPDIVEQLFGFKFSKECVRCLKAAVSRDDASAVLAWLNCIKCLLCAVTSSLPKMEMESPAPREGGGGGWGSSIMSPGEMTKMSSGGGGRGCVEDFGAESFVFGMILGRFSEGAGNTRSIEDVASWILSAVATLAGRECFASLFKGRRGGEEIVGNLHAVVKGGVEGGSGGRCVVRVLRVLLLGEAESLGLVARDAFFVKTLKEVGARETANGGEGGEEMLLCTKLLKRLKALENI